MRRSRIAASGWNTLFSLAFILAVVIIVPELSAAYTWQNTFGGSGMDGAAGVQQTSDGGFILVGQNQSVGSEACYLIRTNATGGKLWEKLFWGTGSAFCPGVRQTLDGGFIASGWTGGELYLVKTDPNGNEQWSQILSGWGTRIGLTADSGYIVTGSTSPWGAGSMLLLKVGSDGTEQWRRTFSGSGYGEEVHQTSDGGYIIVGTQGLIRTDAAGNELWRNPAYGPSVQATSDGGFVITGTSNGIHLIKVDSSGNEQWTKFLGGVYGRCVRLASDGGYLITGDNAADLLLIKTDADGNTKWAQALGGSGLDEGHSGQQTRDGGYIMAGATWSFGAGSRDAYLVYYRPDYFMVLIDVKPGSSQNTINLGASGVIPVAILSSSTFDAPVEVNPETLTLAGARVRIAGKSGKYQCNSQDVNGDDLADLVCHFENELNAQVGDSIVVLEGETYAGVSIRGEDTIRIVP